MLERSRAKWMIAGMLPSSPKMRIRMQRTPQTVSPALLISSGADGVIVKVVVARLALISVSSDMLN